MGCDDQYRKCAHQLWPHAEWIDSDGQYASVADCGGATTVCLVPTMREAIEANRIIDDTGADAPGSAGWFTLELRLPCKRPSHLPDAPSRHISIQLGKVAPESS